MANNSLSHLNGMQNNHAVQSMLSDSHNSFWNWMCGRNCAANVINRFERTVDDIYTQNCTLPENAMMASLEENEKMNTFYLLLQTVRFCCHRLAVRNQNHFWMEFLPHFYQCHGRGRVEQKLSIRILWLKSNIPLRTTLDSFQFVVENLHTLSLFLFSV